MTIHEALRSACEQAGIVFKDVPADGRWHATDIQDDPQGKGDGRIKLFPDGEGGLVANWKSGDEPQPFFLDDGRKLTDAERLERDRRRKEAVKIARAEEKKRHDNAAEKAVAIWAAATPARSDHPYLTTKGVKPYGVRVLDGRLIVPVMIDGVISCLQFIDGDGGKKILTGGRVGGGFHLIGEAQADGVICVAEGYATAATIHEAAGLPVAVAFSAGNLEAVAVSFRKAYPSATLIVCGDDDHATPGNPGRTKATAAAKAAGGVALFPEFGPERTSKLTDFNDMAAVVGVAAVRERTMSAVKPAGEEKKPLHDDVRRAYLPANDTELGNANRLAAVAGNDLRFTPEMGWFAWAGKNWAPDDGMANSIYTERVITKIWAEAGEALAAHNHAQVSALAKWARRSETTKIRAGSLDMAKYERPFRSKKSDFDNTPWLFNVQNGTVDLKTGELRPHRRDDLITNISPVTFDPAAVCPTWENFLHRIMDGSKEMVSYLRRVFGYILTGETREQCFFFCYGTGGNGKSRFIDTITNLMGRYAVKADIESFMLSNQTKASGAASPDLVAMSPARFVFATETADGRAFDMGRIKDMTGGEMMTARPIYGNPFQFRPVWKICITGNHKPTLKDTTYSTRRRLHMIPFTVQIPDNEKDSQLQDKLNAELPGILRWAVQGCLEWQAEELRPPAAVVDATQEYLKDQDVIGRFIDECCYISERAQAPASILYQAYRKWCDENGHKAVMSQTKFGSSLADRGFPSIKGGATNITFRTGIGVLSNVSRTPDSSDAYFGSPDSLDADISRSPDSSGQFFRNSSQGNDYKEELPENCPNCPDCPEPENDEGGSV